MMSMGNIRSILLVSCRMMCEGMPEWLINHQHIIIIHTGELNRTFFPKDVYPDMTRQSMRGMVKGND